MLVAHCCRKSSEMTRLTWRLLKMIFIYPGRLSPAWAVGSGDTKCRGRLGYPQFACSVSAAACQVFCLIFSPHRSRHWLHPSLLTYRSFLCQSAPHCRCSGRSRQAGGLSLPETSRRIREARPQIELLTTKRNSRPSIALG